MHPAQRNLFQDITYWAPLNGSATNDFGHVETGNGVLIKGRWEETVQQVRRPNGDEVTSTTTVFVDREIMVGGFLLQGDHKGGPLQENAQEIQASSTVPDLRNLGHERRAYL